MGSALGGCVHVFAGAVGVSALVMASATAFTALKAVGGLYLIYLGILTWRSAAAPTFAQEGATGPDASQAFRQGITVEATTPKMAAFLLAIIPQFVDASRGSVAAAA